MFLLKNVYNKKMLIVSTQDQSIPVFRNNNYGTVDIVEKRLILMRCSLSRGAVLDGLRTLMSTHSGFWYCRYSVRELFIKRWHVQILYKRHRYNCLEFMDFHILHHLNIFDSDSKQFFSVYIGRLLVVNIQNNYKK